MSQKFQGHKQPIIDNDKIFKIFIEEIFNKVYCSKILRKKKGFYVRTPQQILKDGIKWDIIFSKNVKAKDRRK